MPIWSLHDILDSNNIVIPYVVKKADVPQIPLHINPILESLWNLLNCNLLVSLCFMGRANNSIRTLTNWLYGHIYGIDLEYVLPDWIVIFPFYCKSVWGNHFAHHFQHLFCQITEKRFKQCYDGQHRDMILLDFELLGV